MGLFMSEQIRRLLPQTIKPLPHIERWLPFVFGLIILWLWVLVSQSSYVIIAPPLDVARAFRDSLLNGSLIRHTGITLVEILFGFTVGVSSAFILGYGIAQNRTLERVIGSYLVGFQAIPLVVVAPVFIYVFGPGLIPNGTISAIIVFFPMLITTIVGMRNVDPNLRDLMRSLMATRWQSFLKLDLPAALPVLFGGLKISTTLAVAGAIVSEAVSSQAGLGYLIYSARYVYDKALMWVGVFTLIALALLLYEMVARLERRLLRWQRAGH
jgi:NitT/TauT family transport system permease protein